MLEVPIVDNDTDWQDFLETFGHHCLYYNLTGKQLGNDDCCYRKSQHEFISAINVSIEVHQGFVSKYLKFNEIQSEFLNNIKWHSWQKSDVEKIIIKPVFWIMIFPYHPNMDVVSDNKKLEELYRLIETTKGRDFDKVQNEIENNIFPHCMKDKVTYIYGQEAMEIYESLLK